MSLPFETAAAPERFLRPADVDNLRRNYRAVQLRSFLRGLRSLAVLVAVIIGAIVVYQRTQSDARFAIRRVEVSGAVHTQRAALNALANRYVGLNLFRLDIDRVRHDLASLDWVARIEIEKALPDTLRVRIVERPPVALVSASDGALRYVDEMGAAFADLSPAIGDSDLPLIIATTREDRIRAVDLIRRLRAQDPAVFNRISEIRPLLPHGYALYDRELGATVYADDRDVSAKWRDLYAVTAAEKFQRGDLQYADLRFDGRIVIKPVHAAAAPASMPQNVPTLITN
jgi:cell division protein FtsQ